MWLKPFYMDLARKFVSKMWLNFEKFFGKNVARAVLHGPFEKIFGKNVAQAILHGPFEKIFGKNVAQAVLHGPF